MQQILHTCGKVRDSNSNEPSFQMVQSPVFQPFIFTVTHNSKYFSYYTETPQRSTSLLKGLPRNIYYERYTVLFFPIPFFCVSYLKTRWSRLTKQISQPHEWIIAQTLKDNVLDDRFQPTKKWRKQHLKQVSK